MLRYNTFQFALNISMIRYNTTKFRASCNNKLWSGILYRIWMLHFATTLFNLR